MRIINSWNDVESAHKGASAAIGNFDGVHIGHQSVLDLARHHSDAPLGVVTFSPHPREYFAPDAAPFRLMSAETRAHRLDRLGVDVLFDLPFDADLVRLTPDEFAKNVLCEGLGLSHVVVGADFCFGNKRAGSAPDLVRLGSTLGFDVTIAPLIENADKEVSSTAIRQALGQGRARDAAEMLGHWHRIDGRVLDGDKRGREIGFPTANMSISGLHPPKFGIYAVLVDILTGPHAGSYQGAASIGTRPTFGENLPNLETFIFDFAGDIYGQELSVALVEYLRPELKFDGIAPLVSQMDADCANARKILANLPPHSRQSSDG